MAASALAGGARAQDPPQEDPPPDKTVPRKYRLPTPGSNIETGGAVVVVRAPLAKVKRVITDYTGYHGVLPRIETSRIVQVVDGETEVYMRAPILRGLAHIWLVARFPEPKPWAKKGIKLRGTYVKGNLDDWRGAWFAFPCGPERTTLRLELFVDLSIPVPVSLVTPELMWAAEKGVTAVRDIAECGKTTVRGA